MWPSFARAQSLPSGDPEHARIHLGALALNPRVNIRDLGVDTNVYNEAADQTRDVTASFGPSLDSWLRAGRASLSGTSELDWHYFEHASSQRAFDASQAGRLDVDLGYIVPYVAGAIQQTSERPNLEIDARIGRRVDGGTAGFMARTGSKLTLGLEQQRQSVQFDDGIFRDVDVATALDRREVNTTLDARYAVTPLTTLVFKAVAGRDRFDHSPDRDTDSIAFLPGIEFKPLALVSGTASVGYRRFDPRSPDALPFHGVVADVNLRYVLRDFTRIELGVTRNPDFSAEDADPYFVASGVSLTVTQELGGGWDVVGRAAGTELAYRGFIDPASGTSSARQDHVDIVGAGIGRRLGNGVRIGIDVNRAQRRSAISDYDYKGTRIGGSITYGY